VAFDSADAYGKFMGRYSEPLSVQLVDLAGVAAGTRVLDVGCGPGALTAELVGRIGPDAVSAIDPSEPFVAAVRGRLPGVDVRTGAAERLPYADDEFDAALAQLVVHFMADPVAGLREMARVTRPGGVVAVSVWDHAGGQGPLSLFWRAAKEVDPATRGEATLPGAAEGQLVALCAEAGLVDVQQSVQTVRVRHFTFDEWWEPYTLGVGPAGEHVRGLTDAGRAALRDRCADLLPDPPFDLVASAWAVRATVA
jgi:SAM-dependent methyltransferase